MEDITITVTVEQIMAEDRIEIAKLKAIAAEWKRKYMALANKPTLELTETPEP